MAKTALQSQLPQPRQGVRAVRPACAAGSHLWGFNEIGELVFDVHDSLVIDPTEERLREEFGNTRKLHLPMQSIIRIEEVEKKGQSAIRDATSGEAVVAPFPVPGKPR